MLDAIDLFCPLLRAPFTESMMKLLGYYGHSAAAGGLGLALAGHGFYFKNERTKRAGIAVLATLLVTAGIGDLIRRAAEPPQWSLRPPSGRAGTAFGLASVLGIAFPGISPLFFALAALAALSRLYLRAQTVGNVVGGSILGLACGIPIARLLIPRPGVARRSAVVAIGWLFVSVFGAGALAFFYAAENSVAAHLVRDKNDPPSRPAVAGVDFGNPEARPSLRFGWSGDESWNGGKRSVVWAVGRAAELVLNLPAPRDYRFRFNAFPHSPVGYACQSVEVRVNEHRVAKVSLAPGWRWYQIDVPESAVRAGRNFIQLYFDHAEAPKSRGRSPDARPLSVAFDELQVSPKT